MPCEASRLYVDSLIHDTPDLSKMITLYAMISRTRVLVALLIVESYTKQNTTYGNVRAMVSQHMFDPLRHFAEACRQEFAALEVV